MKNSLGEPPEKVPTFDVSRWLGVVVKRCLLQVGAMQAVEEKMKRVARRSAQITQRLERENESPGKPGAS